MEVVSVRYEMDRAGKVQPRTALGEYCLKKRSKANSLESIQGIHLSEIKRSSLPNKLHREWGLDNLLELTEPVQRIQRHQLVYQWTNPPMETLTR